MQRASKLFVASVSAPPAVPQLQGWEDLPDELLHSVIALLCSFHDLLAFAATCHSWRAAFSSYPSKSTFCSVCPPLLVQFNASAQAPRLSTSSDARDLLTCKVIDPANQKATIRIKIPQEFVENMMRDHGYSYGQLICYRCGYFSIVDVFTSAEVSSPRLPLSNDCHQVFYCAILTAPLASPNSNLLVSTHSSLYDWPIGSDSWSELGLSKRLRQIVHYNGQFIAMDCLSSVYTLQLTPRLSLQKIITKWFDILTTSTYSPPWIVVCSDMLVMVKLYHAFHLDMSTKPAEWVEVKLDNWAFFEAGPVRSHVFSCMSPERWGGWSCCLYHTRYWILPCIVLELDSYRDPMYHEKWFPRAAGHLGVPKHVLCRWPVIGSGSRIANRGYLQSQLLVRSYAFQQRAGTFVLQL